MSGPIPNPNHGRGARPAPRRPGRHRQNSWSFSLGVAWESFCWVQLLGFAILLTGTVVYVKIVRVPGLAYPAEEDEAAAGEAKALELSGGEEDSQALLLGGGGAVNT